MCIRDRAICVLNKADLPQALDAGEFSGFGAVVRLSARTGEGLGELDVYKRQFQLWSNMGSAPVFDQFPARGKTPSALASQSFPGF